MSGKQDRKGRAVNSIKEAWTAATDAKQNATRELKDHLRDGEEVASVLSGESERLVASTQQRLFVIARGLSKRITALEGSQVTGITVHPGLINHGWVVVHAAG